MQHFPTTDDIALFQQCALNASATPPSNLKRPTNANAVTMDITTNIKPAFDATTTQIQILKWYLVAKEFVMENELVES